MSEQRSATMHAPEFLQTGAATLLFVAVFLFGERVRPVRRLIGDHRSIVSFGAGMSSAYVFVHVMPELSVARHSFAETTPLLLWFKGMVVYFVALIGFLLFYALDHLRKSGREFDLHQSGFAAYVALAGYLLVNHLEHKGTALYAIAIACHFLAVDHELAKQHGVAYTQWGRFILAGMSVLGWALGLMIALPHYVIALLVAFLSGAVIMNSTVMELPSEKDGRFLPFVMGGLIYGVILLPLG
jgi:hypothetical protein